MSSQGPHPKWYVGIIPSDAKKISGDFKYSPAWYDGASESFRKLKRTTTDGIKHCKNIQPKLPLKQATRFF